MLEPTDKVLLDSDFIIDGASYNAHTNKSPSNNMTDRHPPRLDVECHVPMDHSPSTCRCTKNVFSSWKFYWDELCMGMTTIFFTLPIITFFTLLALLNTAKRRFTMTSNATPHQRRLHALKVDEKITQDETYYARRWGYNCQQYSIKTKDGYILKMYRFSSLRQKLDGELRKPVLIGHGLFQCSGDFVLNEKESLVFTLVDQGYDVWSGNNRAVGSTEHVCLSENDPCYWNWGLKELSLYDLPAMLDHITATTGYKKVGYIGHSQGNAQAFIALSLQPEIANKMSCFIALAPAIVSGSLVTAFPLRLLIHLNKKTFRFLFGRKAFLGMMTTAQKRLPPAIMATLAYSVFSYLFSWWDSHWVLRRKVKYFQYTPRPVSTRLLLDWLEGWGQQGVCLHINKSNDRCNSNDKSTTFEKIPLAIIYGSDDYLVDGASFVRSFEGYENHGLMEDEWRHLDQNQRRQQLPKSPARYSFSFPSLQLVFVKRIPGYEHMDTIWAHDNTSTSYPAIIEVLDNASWKSTKA